MSHRFSRRKRIGAVVVAAFLVAAAALAVTLGTAGANQNVQRSHHRLGVVSSANLRAVNLLPADVRALQRFAESRASLGDVSLLGVRGGQAFYRIENSNGSACYAAGAVNATDHLLGQIMCSAEFPSASRPLLDFTVIHGMRSDFSQDRVWRSEGIAADGVRQVAFRTPDGRTVGVTPVINNIYAVASVPTMRVTSLIAMDASGAVVATLPASR